MIFDVLNLTPWQIVLVVTCGLFAGTINTVAGGGSLIILPLYLYLGVPPTFTNYINRIPILMQSASATASYTLSKKLQWRSVTPYLLPILCGAAVGAVLAVDINEKTINRILLAVICFVIISLVSEFFANKEETHARLKRIFSNKSSYWVSLPILFAVGLYGGFIQIGVGLIIYPTVHIICKCHYLTSTIIKVCTIFFMCLLSLAIFWTRLTPPMIYLGLLTGAGSIIGGVIGTKMTLGPHGETVIRIFLILVCISGLLRLIFSL